jgi:hypothetical protein
VDGAEMLLLQEGIEKRIKRGELWIGCHHGWPVSDKMRTRNTNSN